MAPDSRTDRSARRQRGAAESEGKAANDVGQAPRHFKGKRTKDSDAHEGGGRTGHGHDPLAELGAPLDTLEPGGRTGHWSEC